MNGQGCLKDLDLNLAAHSTAARHLGFKIRTFRQTIITTPFSVGCKLELAVLLTRTYREFVIRDDD